MAIIRLIISAFVAFVFYASWAYYANSLVSDNHDVLLKAAIVQGTYSGSITLVFTFLLELFNKLFSNKSYCLAFVVPSVIKASIFSKKCATTATFNGVLADMEKKCQGLCLPGMLITPLPALAIQSLLVIAVNIYFQTPNLWLTVLPSILFSGIYGYVYSISITKKRKSGQLVQQI